MLKRKRSGPGRRVPAQSKKGHEKRTGFQNGESLSDLIEEATLLLRIQIEDYSTIQDRLIMRFDEMAAVSIGTQITDLRAMIDLQIQTSEAVTKIVTALERLTRLSPFIR